MGKIKSAMIKRLGGKLTKEIEFTENFGENKKILDKTMPSKKIRNILAGYIIRLEKQKKAEKQKLAKIT